MIDLVGNNNESKDKVVEGNDDKEKINDKKI